MRDGRLDIVLDDSLVLIEHGSLDEAIVFLHRSELLVFLASYVFHPLLLLLKIKVASADITVFELIVLIFFFIFCYLFLFFYFVA